MHDTAAGEIEATKGRVPRGTDAVPAPMDVDHDGQADRGRGRRNVDGQAVFATRRLRLRPRERAESILRGNRSELRRVANASPGFCGHGGAKSPVAERGSGERDAAPFAHLTGHNPADGAARGLYLGRVGHAFESRLTTREFALGSRSECGAGMLLAEPRRRSTGQHLAQCSRAGPRRDGATLAQDRHHRVDEFAIA